MDIGLILILILINGVFAMSEMSLVSSGLARLQKLAGEKRPGARTALKLHKDPSRFLSTVQVGITSVGILSGALGEEALTEPLYRQLLNFPLLVPYAQSIALIATVFLLTYCSVVVGELVPKRLALLHPERIAIIIAQPMHTLSRIASPLVWLLSSSSTLILRIFGAHRPPQTSITNEEIKLLMEIGAESGVFHASESHLVGNILQLDEQMLGAAMTPRQQIYAIDLSDTEAAVREKIADCPYTRAVIYRDSLENVVGILLRSDLLKLAMAGAALDIAPILHAPLYVPESMTLSQLLGFFQEKRTDLALVVNEYGDIEGLVTLSDVLKAIVGHLPSRTNLDIDVVQRADGSWLVDGGLSIQRLKTVVGMDGNLPGEADSTYHTVGGFILFYLEKIPQVTDNFEFRQWRFEIVDIDGTRIDKVLVSQKLPESTV
ncbi:hemolysin family protein [Methylomonas albis]|uniref:HlyC/CorC family transporter n=1 Tax=Methylomonas albis TaxID=1854563 RepID=A0ABR9D741_9GAMM|nr:hemolysin family protein [Methylomonas albis]MBD9358918.1 HlyC/CorC family transporter [Methylomonas albis]